MPWFNTAQNQNAGPSNFQDLAFVKTLDINSIAISKAVATFLAQPTMVIEFKMYANAGDATPYYSIKCTNIAFNSFSIGLSAAGNGFAEQITLSPVIFGYKNGLISQLMAGTRLQGCWWLIDFLFCYTIT